MTTVEDFLPKYPNIHNMAEADFLNPYDDGESFEEALFKKREFFQERLPIEETRLTRPGMLYRHQEIISRFLSDHTRYNSLLIFHETGTGKTCTSIGVIEKIRGSKDNEFTGAIVLAPREKLLSNFKKELVFECTDGIYVPEDYERLTEAQQIKRVNAQVRSYYQLDTYEKFAKKINRLSPEAIRSQYSYKIIVFDEAHHLTEKSERQRAGATGGFDKYQSLYRFLHEVKNCKIILMTATPMKDDPSEIAPLMNLLLPRQDALPIKERFSSTFFPEESTGQLENVELLRSAFKGRVSHIKSMPSLVRKVFMGERIGDLQLLPVVGCQMSDYQTVHYNAAYLADTEGESGGVYSNSQQASLFVFPPLAEGDEGGRSGSSVFNKNGTDQTYIRTIESRLDAMKRKKPPSYSLSREFEKWLKHGDQDEHTNILNNIEQCSCMYADALRSILAAAEQGRCSFVYCSYVFGSGIILFSLLLKLLGFSSATSGGGIDHHRYFLASNASSTELDRELKRFNQPENRNGRDISVIIGSGVISEGFTFMNIQEIQILTPHWNYSETVQAIGRGHRLGSHQALIEDGATDVEVRIYQRVPIPNGGEPSIFLRMYSISEDKDIQIKKIERILKTSAFDCALTYQRNIRQGYDGERDCDYMECDYVCDGFQSIDEYSSPPLPPPGSLNDAGIELDDTTYRLYYNGPLVDQIKFFISQQLFLLPPPSSRDGGAVFRRTLSEIEEQINSPEIIEQIFEEGSRNITLFEILTALKQVIDDNVPVFDKYGLVSYLREQDDIYFLLRQVSHSEDPLLAYYTKNISLWGGCSYQEAITSIGNSRMPDRVTSMCQISDFDHFEQVFTALPLDLQNSMIEQCIEVEDAVRRSKSLRLQGNRTVREFINRIAQDDILILEDGTVVNTFPESNMKDVENAENRCLVEGKWVNYDADMAERVRLKKKAHLEPFFNSPYRYYGRWNAKLKKFWVTDTKGVDLNATVDGRGGKGGTGKTQDCGSWSKPQILAILLSLSVDIPEDAPERVLSTTEVQDRLAQKANNDARKVLKLNDLDSTTSSLLRTLDGKQRLLHWCKSSHKQLCNILRDWFDENNLLDVSNITLKSVMKNKSKEKEKSKKGRKSTKSRKGARKSKKVKKA